METVDGGYYEDIYKGEKMLERNLPISALKVGDIVLPEGKYLTSAGYYFQMGRGFRVKRINRKSISLAPLVYVDGEWIEEDVVRIPREAVVFGYAGGRTSVEPLFGRDNARIEK